MLSNTFGLLYRITSFGESHGKAVGCVVDGCPANFSLKEEDIQKELDRRKPGQSSITTQRKEEDKIYILSGVFQGKTTGAPILLLVYNKDARPEDYLSIKDLYRPGHADYTYEKKYLHRDWRGGGRSSARITLGWVAAGAIAKKFLKEKLNIEILAFVEEIYNLKANIDIEKLSLKDIESNIVRCPDEKIAQKMIRLIEKTKKKGDSLGGVIKCVIRNVPVGFGEPVFSKLSADLGKAILTINACKGFEIGSGFYGTKLTGSQHNDQFYLDKKTKQIKTKTNFAGGVLGGISNGETIYFRAAFKPISTIKFLQKTLNKNNQQVSFQTVGRHDPCVLPRAVPIVEAMAANVIMDHYLRFKSYQQ